MLSNTARGLPRFSMTRDRPSTSTRRVLRLYIRRTELVGFAARKEDDAPRLLPIAFKHKYELIFVSRFLDLFEEVRDFLAGALRGVNHGLGTFLRARRHLFAAVCSRVAGKGKCVLGAVGGFDDQLLSAAIYLLDRSFGFR